MSGGIVLPEYMAWIETVQKETQKSYKIVLIKDGKITPAYRQFRNTESKTVTTTNHVAVGVSPNKVQAVTKTYRSIICDVEQKDTAEYTLKNLNVSCSVKFDTSKAGAMSFYDKSIDGSADKELFSILKTSDYTYLPYGFNTDLSDTNSLAMKFSTDSSDQALTYVYFQYLALSLTIAL